MPYNAVKPEQAGYNIFSPTYAKTLGETTGNPGADVIRHMALMMRAKQEDGDYASAVAAANANQLQGTQIEQDGALRKAIIDTLAARTQQGVGGAVDAQGNVDNTYVGHADTHNINKVDSEAFKNNTGGLKDMADAGYGLKPAAVGPVLAGPEVAPQDAPQFQSYVNPGDVAAQQQAAASMVAAHRPPSGGANGDEPSVTITDPGMGLPPAIAYKLKNASPAEVAALLASLHAPGATPPGANMSRPAPAGFHYEGTHLLPDKK